MKNHKKKRGIFAALAHYALGGIFIFGIVVTLFNLETWLLMCLFAAIILIATKVVQPKMWARQVHRMQMFPNYEQRRVTTNMISDLPDEADGIYQARDDATGCLLEISCEFDQLFGVMYTIEIEERTYVRPNEIDGGNIILHQSHTYIFSPNRAKVKHIIVTNERGTNNKKYSEAKKEAFSRPYLTDEDIAHIRHAIHTRSYIPISS